jgi:hypothetical protein
MAGRQERRTEFGRETSWETFIVRFVQEMGNYIRMSEIDCE